MSRGPSALDQSLFDAARAAAPWIFKKYGFTANSEWLGNGAFGSAWLSSKGKFVKLTESESEAGLALLLEGQAPIGFPRVYAVRLVELQFPLYAIFMERVTPHSSLNETDRKRLASAVRAAEFGRDSDDPWVHDLAQAILTIDSMQGRPDLNLGNVGVAKDGSAVILDLGHDTEFHGGVKLAR